MAQQISTAQASSHHQQLRFTISIFDEDTVLTDHTGNADRKFLVSPEQLMKFFNTNTKVVFKPEPGLLSLQFDGEGEIAVLRLPKKTRTIIVLEGKKRRAKTYSVQFPAMLATIAYNRAQNSVNGLSINCIKGSLRPGATLYEVPLPNISPQGGVCLGGVDKKLEKTLAATIERMLFDTPFNNHGDSCGIDSLPFKAFHKKFKGTIPFAALRKAGHYRPQ